MAQAGARATQIVGRNVCKTASRTSCLHHTPDDLWAEATFSNSLGLVDGPKDRPGSDASGGQPTVHRRFDPARDWYGPHMAALADQVGDYPMLFALLQTFRGEASGLRSPRSTSEEDREHGIVTLSAQAALVDHRQELLALIGGQPIPDSHAMLFDALHPPDACRKIGAQQPAVGSLVGKPADGRQSEVDRRGSITSLLETDAVSGNDGFVESQAGSEQYQSMNSRMA